MRDGYLNQFNYRLPQSGKVSIRIEGTNKETRLFVNDRRMQILNRHDVYAIPATNRLDKMPGAPFQTEVYEVGAKMSYVPTLFFPLKQAGNFRSTVSNLRIMNL